MILKFLFPTLAVGVSPSEVIRCAETPLAVCLSEVVSACPGTQATSQPSLTRRLDYRALPYTLNEVKIAIDLDANMTTIDSELEIEKLAPFEELVLNGSPDMHLALLSVDEGPTEIIGNSSNVESVCLNHTDWTLRIRSAMFAAKDTFKIKSRVMIAPNLNKQLFGLYETNGLLVSQNEAQGFRRITYFPDRPDILAIFNVTLLADEETYPILLANGDRTAVGRYVVDGVQRHWATFFDPWPKPSYLFAVVAGKLSSISRQFQVGRPCVEAVASFYDVDVRQALSEPLYIYCERFPDALIGDPFNATLYIWGEPGKESRLDWALTSLEKAMLWDEVKYGRFYDLNEFHVVAAKDFNAGAMENKGLNIFNEALILADPNITTDMQFQRIQAVIAHEYFHNWSGDRVTLRDWFQLTLKEGFTVFRDQQFTEDFTKSAVKRIEDSKFLQDVQFREDAGPLAHPPRPDEYATIENFYSVTVYEKGAEIIRMYQTLLGWEKFRTATDFYFNSQDGRAATLEDFLASMELASGEDLSQFFLWYSTPGTPHVNVVDRRFHRRKNQYEITLTQTVRGDKPLLIPIAMGLLSQTQSRDILPTQILRLTQERQTFWISNVTEQIIPTLNRGFSAPVIIGDYLSNSELTHQALFDECGYIKWQAGQTLMRKAVLKELAHPNHDPVEVMSVLQSILLSILEGGSGFVLNNDMAGLAYRLMLPPVSSFEDDLAIFDPLAVHEARRRIRRRISLYLRDLLWETYTLLDNIMTSFETYQISTSQVGVRFLRNEILSLLAAVTEDPEIAGVIFEHLNSSPRENEIAAALGMIANFPISEFREKALRIYRRRAAQEDLLIDRWLSAQARSTARDTLDKVMDLAQQPSFVASTNPNRIRALLNNFASNLVALNAADGSGYKFLGDEVIRVDRFNPKVAARIAKGFTHWAKYPPALKQTVLGEIERVLGSNISVATREILVKAAQAGQVEEGKTKNAEL